MNLYHRCTEWMFSVPEGRRSVRQIIAWWELRRIPYNLIVGMLGVVSFFILSFFIAKEPIENGQDVGEPFMLILAPFIINVCYTAGWVVEAFFPLTFVESFLRDDDERFGPKLLRQGLQLSLFLVFLPTVMWGVLSLLRTLGVRS